MADEINSRDEPPSGHGRQRLREVCRFEKEGATRIYAVHVHDNGTMDITAREQQADGATRAIARQHFSEAEKAAEWLTAQQMWLQAHGWSELQAPAPVTPLGSE